MRITRIGILGNHYEENIRRLYAIIGEFLNKKMQKCEKAIQHFDAVLFDWAGTWWWTMDVLRR